MRLSAVLANRAAAWAGLLRLAYGSPVVNFPVNAQVPPVARLAQPFSFVFAKNTFASSSSSPLTYSLDNPPSWLSIDSDERWLHGTPQDGDIAAAGGGGNGGGGDGDVVGVPFGLVATDSAGGTTTSNVTLVVSRDPAPTVQIPVAQQLASSGHPFSEPSSLLLYPASPVDVVFSPATFSRAGLNYYAVSGDNSPLPSWIAFDAASLTFSGTTPPADSLVEPPQTFDFQLIASDVTGFAAAAVAFSLVVGNRQLTVDDPAVVLNATVGQPLVYDALQSGVKMDGKIAGPANLTATVPAGSSPPPDWLTFDADTWVIRGTPPSSAQNAAFTISFSDALSDTVNATFQVTIDENGTVFRGALPETQAQRGGHFALDLAPYLVQTDGVDVTVQSQPAKSWIHFDAAALTVSGDVPISEEASSVSVSVRVASTASNATGSETFLLQIVSGSPSTTNSSSTASSATAAATSGAPAKTTAAEAASGRPKSSATPLQTVLLAVLIPTLLLAFVLAVIACCLCRRRRRKRRAFSQHLTNKDISDPVPLSFAYNGQQDMVSSMRALDKEYRVSNLNSVQAQKTQEKDWLHAAHDEPLPVGIALALTTNEKVERKSQIHDAGGAWKNRHGADRSVPSVVGIPDFPVPPQNTPVAATLAKPPSSHSEASGRWLRGPSYGHWQFGKLTPSSSLLARDPSRANSRPGTSQQVATGPRDALGIQGGTRVTDHDGDHSSVTVMADESRSTLFSSRDDGGGGGVPAAPKDGNAAAAAARSFLTGVAARIATRFKKDRPVSKSQIAKHRLSQGFPSPDAASVDTDLGSVTFGNVTTAQPYRPKPVFIGTVNRITEESPQPSSARWDGKANDSRTVPAPATPSGGGGGRTGDAGEPADGDERRRTAGYEILRGDGQRNSSNDRRRNSENEAAAAVAAAAHLDPPQPAFLGPSRAGQDADLSQEIARSLASRRPSSATSGMSGISAAMEEVRSLLLLSYDSPSDRSRCSPQNDGSGSNRGEDDMSLSPSSNSWETLSSSEPNWTSLCDFGLPKRQQADEPLTPTGFAATAVPQPTASHLQATPSRQPTQPPQTPAAEQQQQPPKQQPPQQQQHPPTHAARAPFAFPVQVAAQPEAAIYNEPELSGTYRQSSYYGEGGYSHEYPKPFVEEGYDDDIGLAVSKYSQAQLDTRGSQASQASLTSGASGDGIKAFI
ncbi:transmembrane glycoprotein [Niveomyces insectorum RCEF 264]|uniref:Transmembrane glycoprotein n=1 Tax=Niveomyces insectorum RCEF 264 TaxID=1081102 RepID=A0A168A264_9HYPO|nr:transmembrane glycoprotein [Niveomyces insectorum RCEF 264]